MEKETQAMAILRHIRTEGGITAIEALNHYQCFRLAARIYDLRKAGHNIGTMMADTQSGKSIAYYYLKKPL